MAFPWRKDSKTMAEVKELNQSAALYEDYAIFWFRAFLFFGVSPIVGAFIGCWIGKRRGFRTQVTEWRETHRSIDETDKDEQIDRSTIRKTQKGLPLVLFYRVI